MSFRDDDDDGTSYENAICISATPLALLIRFRTPAGKTIEEKWIPRSVVHDNSSIWENGHEGQLVVRTWFAEKESL